MKTSLVPFADQSNSQDSTTGNDQASQKRLGFVRWSLETNENNQKERKRKKSYFLMSVME